MNNQRAFTLVELLISTSIMMMVFFVGYYSYSLFSSSWGKRADAFWSVTDNGIGIEFLNRVLQSCSQYIVRGSASGNKPMYLFDGGRNYIYCVSNNGLVSSERSLIHIYHDNSSQVLVYEEHALLQDLVVNWPQKDIVWDFKITLLENVNDFNISYFGFENMTQALRLSSDRQVVDLLENDSELASYSRHDPIIRQVMPLKVEVEIFQFQGERKTNLLQVFNRFSILGLVAFDQVGDLY
ncbi:prepilin-type N-terminal cleavage/methylation domain-containing protein [Pseudoalteromonas fenneropenaei]|uniref:Prepilin-type N-terminal cleavage/methylation domain-containing protein n=1 Tax=Pseudoalteromonas fenneropenaei TaxID=1737459 RepID=A0ABV7CKB5_9GAMM